MNGDIVEQIALNGIVGSQEEIIGSIEPEMELVGAVENGYIPVPGPKGDPGKDGLDGHSPKQDLTTMTWWDWSDETQDYYDTGIPFKGSDGRDGEQGPPGKDGKDGEQGPPGTDGKDGIQGPPGKDGADGAAGPQGQPGKDGLDGKDGADGLPGPPGKDGKDGEPGPSGPPGADGSQGPIGKTGVGIAAVLYFYGVSDDGYNAPNMGTGPIPEMTPTNRYLWSYSQTTYTDGSKSKSPAGVIGVYGDPGKDGVDAHSPYIGPDATWWVYNDTTQQYEDTGLMAEGAPGADGQPGTDGHSPYIHSETFTWWVYNDQAKGYVDTGIVAQGQDGQPGKDGTDGAPGADGQPGKDGADGKDGKDGVDGAPGADGQPGKDGKDGYTPVKGVDYWTPEDQEEIVDDTMHQMDHLYLRKDGGIMEGPINMDNYKVENVPTPADPLDAANKMYVDRLDGKSAGAIITNTSGTQNSTVYDSGTKPLFDFVLNPARLLENPSTRDPGTPVDLFTVGAAMNPTITLSANQLDYSLAGTISGGGASWSGSLEEFKLTATATGTWRRMAFKLGGDLSRFNNRPMSVSVSGFEASYNMATFIPRMWLQCVTSSGSQTGPSISLGYPSLQNTGTITVPSDAKDLWLFVCMDNGVNVTAGNWCVFKNIQLVYGDERIEPSTIKLTDTYIAQVDSNHMNAIKAFDGVYTKSNACGLYTFTGDEPITQSGTGFAGGESSTIFNVTLPFQAANPSSTNMSIFNRFYFSSALTTRECCYITYSATANGICRFSIKNSRLSDISVAGFRQWLKDNPTYGFITTVANVAIPLSPAEDAAIKTAKTGLGYTKITCDKFPDVSLTISYVADTKLYIDNSIKNAIAGLTP